MHRAIAIARARFGSSRLAHNLAKPAVGVDFDSFTFGLNGMRTEHMWLSTFNSETGEWAPGGIVPHAPLSMEPSATVLNYGQGIFEGMKAFRQPDGGVSLFRPQMNAARMREGAERMLLAVPPEELFIQACEAVVAANAKWVPPTKRGTLYLRPLLFGSGAQLGVAPSPQTTFCVFASPVGNYFRGKPGELAPPISLQVSGTFRRAMEGGAGGTKAAGNYAPCFLASKLTKESGFSEVLFLDSLTGTKIEEAGASNFFAVVPASRPDEFELVTTATQCGTILPGVTRASVLQIAREELVGQLQTTNLVGVRERALDLRELAGCREAFCTGTGASVTSVGSVSVPDGVLPEGQAEYTAAPWGEVTRAVAEKLFATQWGDIEDARGWMHPVHG
jgi:branched-chain amino acid aminotransferase